MKYKEWIEQNTKGFDDAYGQCKKACEAMAEAFPELVIVRGHYYCTGWGERGHFWLVDPQGNIVDPTADQFPSKGRGHYEPWDESQPEPTGKCLDCGAYTFNGDTFCSNECEAATRTYMNGSI